VNDPAIARAKITPAPVREATLARERLLGWLAESIQHRLIAVVADTGYGKTTLLADFTRRAEIRCLWYRLDAADRDWVAFLNYLVAAGREYVPDFGAATLQMLQSIGTTDPPLERVLAIFIAELDALGSEPTVLILDDYHLVDTDPDIRTILTRLIADAPARLSFVLLSRRRPRLALGRLAAQGSVAELGTEELRFSPGETEQLFRDTYHLPLEGDTLAQVEARTEGWAASLQMLRSSLQGRSPEAIGRFVGTLTGAEGRLYDYLAEEVMAELEPALQRFLALTSILDTVTPELVSAIYAADPMHPGDEVVEGWTREAHQEGLMARRDAVGSGERYHPLFRDLLTRHLSQMASGQEIRAMHVRVARAAEDADWLVSARHYIRGGSESDAIRVLSANVTHALGSGQWGEAAELIREVRAPNDDPRLAVILAREDIYHGRLEDGLGRLERFDLSLLDGPTRALLVQARIHALLWLGRHDEVAPLAATLERDWSVPDDLREIASGTVAVALSARDGSLTRAGDVLRHLAASHRRAGRYWFEGISRHNLLILLIAQGDLEHAVDEGGRALEAFARLSRPPDEQFSTHLELARAHAEKGRFELMEHHLAVALSGVGIGAPERKLEAAHLRAVLGDIAQAKELLRDALGSGASVRAQNAFAAAIAEARVRLAEGHPDAAVEALGGSLERFPVWTTGSWLLWLHTRAVCSLAAPVQDSASEWVAAGAHLADAQGSRTYRRRFALLAALVCGERSAMAEAAASAEEMDLLLSVEALVPRLHLFGGLPEGLRRSVERWPQRWLPTLRQAVREPFGPGTLAAAELLEQHGDTEDVPALRRVARVRGSRHPDLGRALAHRRSPKVMIRDLGRGSLAIGPRTLEIASMRRRAAATLCFLLSRATMSATKDQALEALWPETSPEASLNSLNQTLYFLRRHIEPRFDEEHSAQVVRFEGDLLWLDQELVVAESHLFHDEAKRALTEHANFEQASQAVERYAGRFAPEFEYDDWASAWREMLHAQYLHLAEWLLGRLISEGELTRAVDVAVRVLAIDSDVESIERALVWLYGALGVRAAAAEQYGHYCASLRNAVGVEPPSLDEVLRTPPAPELG
jgi:LuxR family maltose regulon positive regulatory protein